MGTLIAAATGLSAASFAAASDPLSGADAVSAEECTVSVAPGGVSDALSWAFVSFGRQSSESTRQAGKVKRNSFCLNVEFTMNLSSVASEVPSSSPSALKFVIPREN